MAIKALDRLSPSSAGRLEIRKRTLGDGHIDYAVSLNNLAGFYVKEGKYEEAAALSREATGLARA